MRLGTTIRQQRDARGLTQDELAARAKITKPYLSQIENGVRANPSLPVLKRLAKALGVPMRELLE